MLHLWQNGMFINSNIQYRVLKTSNTPDGNVCMINTVTTEPVAVTHTASGRWDNVALHISTEGLAEASSAFLISHLTSNTGDQHRAQYKQVKCTVRGCSGTHFMGSGTCVNVSRPPGTPQAATLKMALKHGRPPASYN